MICYSLIFDISSANYYPSFELLELNANGTLKIIKVK